MKNIKTIVSRDLGAYFTSPVGYIFIIVFLAMSVGIFMTSFFTFPMADMRNFFANLPIILCVFIPAVTMRVWAEERKENTWELLLTFPMRARELVLGKYFATLAFYLITLAATFTVPLMLAVLGNPDGGMIIGGYLGAALLGAMFLSMGLFFSGFCKDQIVAFVVTLLACFAVFLVGTNFIAGYIDGFFPGLGSALSQMAGLIDHYNAFIRGVVEVAHRNRVRVQYVRSEGRSCQRRLSGSRRATSSGPEGLNHQRLASLEAERVRWRCSRSRRSRLTSNGSCSRASGRSISALSSW